MLVDIKAISGGFTLYGLPQLRLFQPQLAIRVEGFVLEEAAHRVGRAEGPGIAGIVLVAPSWVSMVKQAPLSERSF